MGMNFYLQKVSKEPFTVFDWYTNTPIEVEKLHIGKSSFGWHFGLCIYENLGIKDLEDWKKLFNSSDYIILDEYDDLVSAENMLDRITNRSAIEVSEQERIDLHNSYSYKKVKSYDELLQMNSAERGKNNLWAHARTTNAFGDRAMYKRTEGTYDLTEFWEFS